MHNLFYHALLDAGQPVPDTVTAHPGRQARFNVYRNNIRASLTEALAAQFPVCRQLVGEDFFNAMAALYIEQSPPATPLLTEYGTTMPAFIAGFAPAASLPYLADMARLELALQQVRHAANAVATDILQALLADPERLAGQSLQLSPACFLLRSSFAVCSLWRAHHGEGRLNEIDLSIAENALLLRPGLTVNMIGLNDADSDFMTALMTGLPLSAALERTAQRHADVNPADLLQCLLTNQAITGVITKGETS
ncbi:putative DNA-binding domain-containing protein [Oceanimonas baumannii]|uniref:HvfC/BufC family peptide modification chaperone n=1 Tax=Oceanimonas baumannii TaxID=129578 RepID=UPI003A91C513